MVFSSWFFHDINVGEKIGGLKKYETVSYLFLIQTQALLYYWIVFIENRGSSGSHANKWIASDRKLPKINGS